MLLPSALSCDSSQPPASSSRLQSALFFSPPSSPPTRSTASQAAFGNIVNTCRSLQSLISTPVINAPVPRNPDATQSLAPLPTPPMAFAPPPMKLRLRTRPDHNGEETIAARRRITKRSAPRGVNKRRRATDDEAGRDDSDMSDYEGQFSELPSPTSQSSSSDELPPRPATPKRARIAPEQLPLGLDRSDFHNLSSSPQQEDEQASEDWTAEDDRVLVELVLEKLKLTKSEWQDCARNLGKDRHALSRRWKSLILNGDVGIKNRSKRGGIHSTWR